MSAFIRRRSKAVSFAAREMRPSPAPLSPTQRLPRRDLVAAGMRIAVLPLVVGFAGCATPAPPVAQPTVPASSAGTTVTVILADFSFSPDRITLRAGVPVRLRLVNQSTGGHDFSAPEFFAKSSFAAGTKAPAGGAIEVGSQQTAEIVLTPLLPGTYPVECTHFLHSLFGMTATIQVVA
jgi:uncharacterized cupredoxin-like copper-binding protein